MPYELPRSIRSAEPLPTYFELKRLLVDAIVRGELRPGDRLPTEQELCSHLGISRTPVRRALSELADEGLVLRFRRRGSFVNPHWFRRQEGLAELRVVVPEGPWERFLQAVAQEAGSLPLSIVAVPWPELHTHIRRAVAEGQAPDVAVLDSVWTAELAEAGFLLPFEEIGQLWPSERDREDFLDNVLATGVYDGKTYGCPAFANVAGLWYLREPLDRIGAAVPTTWAELRDVLRSLRRAGLSHPFAMSAGPLGGETTTYSLLGFMAANGASVLDAGRVTLAGPATAETLGFLEDLLTDELMAREVVSLEWDGPIKLLGRKEVAVVLAGSYDGEDLAHAFGVPVDALWEHAGFAAIPGGPRGRPTGGAIGAMVYGIFRQSANPTLALQLVQAATTPAALAHLARATERIPPRRSAVRLADRWFVSASAALLADAVTRPITPWYPRVSTQLQLMLEAVLVGGVAPGAAARRAAELIAAITGLPQAKSERGRRAASR